MHESRVEPSEGIEFDRRRVCRHYHHKESKNSLTTPGHVAHGCVRQAAWAVFIRFCVMIGCGVIKHMQTLIDFYLYTNKVIDS